MDEQKVDVSKVVVGAYADYMDTGVWTMRKGELIAPSNLTIEQLKDFLLATGGGVYLGEDGLFRWARMEEG